MALNNPVVSGDVNLTTDYAVVLDVLDANTGIEYRNFYMYNPSAQVVLVVSDGDDTHPLTLPAQSIRSFGLGDSVTITESVKAKGVGGAANGCRFEMWQSEE